jgi:hypothetical protein
LKDRVNLTWWQPNGREADEVDQWLLTVSRATGIPSGNLEGDSFVAAEWWLTLVISTDKVVVSRMASGELITTRSIPATHLVAVRSISV